MLILRFLGGNKIYLAARGVLLATSVVLLAAMGILLTVCDAFHKKARILTMSTAAH